MSGQAGPRRFTYRPAFAVYDTAEFAKPEASDAALLGHVRPVGNRWLADRDPYLHRTREDAAHALREAHADAAQREIDRATGAVDRLRATR